MGEFTSDELINWHLEKMELRSNLLAQKGIYGGIFVEDFTGLSMSHWYKPAVDMLKVMMNVDQQGYPEFSTVTNLLISLVFVLIVFTPISRLCFTSTRRVFSLCSGVC
jgi:hypothetical protein